MPLDISFEELNRLYTIQRFTTVKIAEMVGVNDSTIFRWLVRYGIPVRGKRVANLGKVFSPEIRANMSAAFKGHKNWLGLHHSPETKEALRQQHIGKQIPIVVREKMSNTHKAKFEDLEYKEKWLDRTRDGMKKTPNTKEAKVMEILNALYPNEWEFVGNKKFRIGWKSLDFINEPKKLIIEHFGVYIHTDRARYYEDTEQGRIEHFAKYGYKTLVIWDVELLYQLEMVIWRIKKFVGDN